MNRNQVDKLNEIRARRISRKNSGGVRNDYGVPGMKWGEHKEEESSAGWKSGTAKASDLASLSKEERNAMLDEAPDGATITGIIVKNGPYAGMETTVKKSSGYHKTYGGVGAGSAIAEDYWEVGGSKDPYFKRTLRTVLEGTNKYYELK